MKLNGYLLKEVILPFLDKMDDVSLMVLAQQSLIRVCEHNCCEKDENGKIIHPCSADCPVGMSIHCTGLAEMRDKTINMIKRESEM